MPGLDLGRLIAILLDLDEAHFLITEREFDAVVVSEFRMRDLGGC